ncbi:MAG TPA: DUF4149 domain-containing protein [Dehalococcoidia bacterium]|nr:DUF4149 domain-containing protein [Dehalococcoidia bacterium]
MDFFNTWLHLIAATVWVGPQVFMFVASIPALRLIDDRPTRVRVLRLMARRFGWLALAALAVLVITGVENLRNRIDDGFDAFNSDFRYIWIFWVKMGLLGLAVIATLLHSFVIGPRQLQLMEAAGSAQASGDGAEATRLRRLSIVLSSLILLLSLAILLVAAQLSDVEYSFERV